MSVPVSVSDVAKKRSLLYSVRKADRNRRFVFLLCDQDYSDTYFFLRPVGVDALHPFTLLDAQHFVYLCIFEDDNTTTLPTELVFNIMSRSSNVAAQMNEKSEVVKRIDASPQPDGVNHAWRIAKNLPILFLDFNSTQSKWNGQSKSIHYKNVAASVIEHVLGCCLRSELAPLHALRIILRMYHWLKDPNRSLLRVPQIRSVYSTQLGKSYRQIQSVRSWKEMSTMLVCLVVLWCIESSQMQANARVIGDVESVKMYQHLIDPRRGSTDNILLNVKEMFGEYLPLLMAKLKTKIANAKQQITKYGYVLWYNLLHCIKADPEPSNRESIEKVLGRTSVTQHFLTLCSCDLTFIAYDRPLKLEYFFVRRLVKLEMMPARMKLDYLVQLLGKIHVLSELYQLLFHFKDDVKGMLGDDTECWFGLVNFVLNACKIQRKPERQALQSDDEVHAQKCVKLVIDLFCYKIQRMHEPDEFVRFCELCDQYPVALSETVCECIINNENYAVALQLDTDVSQFYARILAEATDIPAQLAKRAIEIYRQQLTQRNAEIESLKQSMQEKLDTKLASVVTEKEAEISRLSEEITANKRDVETMKAQEESVIQQNKDLQLQNALQQTKTEELESVKQSMQTQLESLQHEIENLKQHAQVTEEEKKCGKDIGGDMQELERAMSAFSDHYSQQNLEQMPLDSLMVDRELDALDLSVRSFGKYINDAKSYVHSLTHPDVTQYRHWDIAQMCQWISLLRDGLFRPYLTVLKNGFESDCISGELLPLLTEATLRNEPFKITKFGHRRLLLLAFQSLSELDNCEDIHAAAAPGAAADSDNDLMQEAEGAKTDSFYK